MKFSHFFIQRPIFAAMLSLIFLIAGAISLFQLPVSEYPEVVPPTVVVTASYPGANPTVIAETVATPLEQEINGGVKLIARDAKGTPLKSVFEWTPEATERILRIPSGFMRDKVQERIESVALDNKVITIDLDLVEKGIEIGRMMMEEMITSQSNGQSAVSNGNDHSRIDSPPVYGSEDVNDYPPNQPPKENLNEVSVMSELDKKRSDN